MLLFNTKIGFIGLGLMGMPMAKNLLMAGLDLTVFNRTASKCTALKDKGAHVAISPQELAQQIGDGFIIFCVSDTPALENALLGDNGVLSGLSAGATIIDMGTSEVSATRKLAAIISAAGGSYIDAPVSGGEIGAKAGSLSIMAGGEPSVIDRAKPIFEILGNSMTRIGAVGTGQAAKVANQSIVGVTVAIIAESLALAQAAGADITQVRTALLGGFAGSRILDLHGQRMIDGEFTPGARATTQLKDMRQAVALANEVGLSLPLLNQSHDLWTEMVDADMGDLDQSGYFKFLKSEQTSKV